MKHRNDIDGLRCIAVGSVVLYHCGFARFLPGGFVGVDVFFVISGFLITNIIAADMARGDFSIFKFYDRRIRRILPALFAVYAFVIVSSLIVMLPLELADVGKSMISSAFFVSNIYFYFTTNYFDASADINSVLHTWSLSVEEQFYIFLPIMLYCLAGLKSGARAAIVATLGIVSFVACVWIMRTDRDAAFYLVHYRAWELLIGSMLALGYPKRVTNVAVNNLLGAVGLCLIGGSVLLLTESDPFPGVSALPTCLGAALILYSGMSGQTVIGRLLSLWPIRFVGLVSYSFYLWHWPVWVVSNQIFRIGRFESVIVILISFVLAVISWRFIETPFRQKRGEAIVPGRTLGWGVGGLVVSSVLATGAIYLPLFRDIPPEVSQVASYLKYDAGQSYRSGRCFLTSGNTFDAYDKAGCLDISDSKQDVFLIGDSHGAQYYPGLSSDASVNVLQATASGCKPVVGATGEKRCTELMSYIFKEFLPSHHVDTIVLAGRWELSDIPALRATAGVLKASANRVVVLGPIVEYNIPLPRILAQDIYWRHAEDVSDYTRTDRRSVDSAIQKAVLGTNLEYVSVIDAVCPEGKCTLWSGIGKPLQFDYGHLTADGSKLVVSRIYNAILAR